MSFDDYQAFPLAAPKVMGELPVDAKGEYAQLILNFRLDPAGFLDCTQRKMHLIPQAWNAGANPTAWGSAWSSSDVLAMGFVLMDGGVRPEIIFITRSGVFRYAPWLRATGGVGNRGIEELLEYRYIGPTNQTNSVIPQSKPQFPPQIRSVGNRVYFTFCDGGQAWVWDGDRLRRFGFVVSPAPPDALGPSRVAGGGENSGGFALRGRIGTTDAGITTGVEETDPVGVKRWAYAYAKQVGGLRAGRWQYAVVYEGVDGAYSAMSVPGGICTHRYKTADPENDLDMSELRRRHWIRNIPVGPPGTVARILLRTPNLEFLPLGSAGEFRFLHRIANNVATEWVDDIPDGELGVVWEDREETPVGFYFLESYGGSTWMLRTEGLPSRAWWSEQGPLGSVAESIKKGHWRDVFPETGPIMGAVSVRPATGDGVAMMLVFKPAAVHYVIGEYPTWQFGTLHRGSGLDGPNLVRACPDGTVVYYGAGTFWRYDPRQGVPVDVGAPIRRRLRKVNTNRTQLGESWVDERAGEIRFVLPMDDHDRPNLHFIWDYLSLGWRLADDMIVDSALSIPGSDLVLLAGNITAPPGVVIAPGTNPAVWIYGRGFPGENYAPRIAQYRTGWASLSGVGPDLAVFSTAPELVLTLEERAYHEANVYSYLDWNLDDTHTIEVLKPYHPENDNIPYASGTGATAPTPAMYGTSVYRTRRSYTHFVHIGADRHQVLAVEVNSDGPLALYTGSAYGPAVAGPRTSPTP